MHWGKGRSHVSWEVKKTTRGNEHCLSGVLNVAQTARGRNCGKCGQGSINEFAEEKSCKQFVQIFSRGQSLSR